MQRSYKTRLSFYLISGLIGVLIAYSVYLYFYLQIAGVYGIATIKEMVATSEGTDIKYQFQYKGEKHEGVFTDYKGYRIGDIYFVLFSKSNPDKNLLQYTRHVPDCLKDSVNIIWEEYPTCSNGKHEEHKTQ